MLRSLLGLAWGVVRAGVLADAGQAGRRCWNGLDSRSRRSGRAHLTVSVRQGWALELLRRLLDAAWGRLGRVRRSRRGPASGLLR
ncbi:hypothetical protein LNKW23_20460 [Paralimibaculum aggregatum]|uniref:Secreted protein n=1 Tax=Paralimibaculum aggregatum TaxID=3036245 RepID=A0ABQ6LHR8_9RHOB|nr:hypothetical protein LNKW23_20460 [Limibaculum sp. NKW23]